MCGNSRIVELGCRVQQSQGRQPGYADGWVSVNKRWIVHDRWRKTEGNNGKMPDDSRKVRI